MPSLQQFQLLCFLFVASNAAHAAGTISNALSAAAAGRGGANLAFGDNGVLLMDNPAGIQSLIVGDSTQDYFVDIGGALLLTDLSYSDHENPITNAENAPSGMGHFMVARRIHEDVVFGLGAFAPAGFASEYDLAGPATLPGRHRYKSFGALVRVLPGISARLTDDWTVGATLGLALSHTDIEGPYYLNAGALRGTPTLLDLRTTGAALSWSCGTQYHVTHQTTIGVRYQSENRFKSDGKANVTIDPLGSSNYDVELGLTWARSAGIGMMHRFDNQQRIAIDFIVEDWSSAHDDAKLTFTKPSNPIFEAIAGPTIEEIFPLRWKDSLVMAVGYERDLSQNRTIRAGYRYQDNPLFRQSLGGIAIPDHLNA